MHVTRRPVCQEFPGRLAAGSDWDERRRVVDLSLLVLNVLWTQGIRSGVLTIEIVPSLHACDDCRNTVHVVGLRFAAHCITIFPKLDSVYIGISMAYISR